MHNIVSKLLLIVAVLALCVLSIWFKDLHLGKDLRGGVSLIYQITIPDDVTDPQQVQGQTIQVLKERVNPAGILDISMQPLGRDRIEIVMPLPNAAVRELAKAFRASLEGLLRESEIPEAQLDDALRRGVAPQELGSDPASERGEAAVALQEAYAARDAARAALEEARASGAAAEALRPLEAAVAEAEQTFDDLRSGFLALSLGEARVRRLLALPTEEQKRKNEDGTPMIGDDGEEVMGPSQREIALDALKAEFPHLAPRIDSLVEAFDSYEAKRTGFDDPEDLIRLLRGAGVLEFHIAVAPAEPEGVDVEDMRKQLLASGPENTTSPNARWYPINELKQWYDDEKDLALLERNPVDYFRNRRGLVVQVFEGRYYLLLYTRSDKSLTHSEGRQWSMQKTNPTVDQLGRPAVAFTLDNSGGGLMGRLTGGHIGQPMAIVLDGEVYSAPNIRGQIQTNGIITGNFSQDEIAYLIRVLAAGSLQARLTPEPIAMNTLGPSIGQDNLRRGKDAFIISLIAVAAFMILYYFFAGVVAVIALAANGLIIFGVMMGIDGTFTLPGLAGIVLTIGMAVDANVLIYERIREELFSGEADLRTAIRQGYRKALSTILDGNITNLIVCFVLFKTATTEVKGFALTLSIGICATLFTALFVTRQIYYLYTDLFKIRRLPMLATVVPAVHRALSPSIDWMHLRKFFWAVSGTLCLASIVLVWTRGVDLFDTEFRGGVSLTMLTAPTGEPGSAGEDVPRLLLRQSGTPDSVEERIRRIGEQAAAATPENDTDRDRLRILGELKNASILTSGEPLLTAGYVQASAFQIKVASPKGLANDRTIAPVVVNAIVEEFGDELDVTRPLNFDGAGDPDSSRYVFPVRQRADSRYELGSVIARPESTERIRDFLGGAVVVLDNLDPPTTPEEIEKRIERMRNQPDFARYSGRRVKAIGIRPAENPADGFRDIAVAVFDPYRSFVKVDAEVWYREVADAEWELIGAALQRPTSLEQVSTFSSAVAETLSAQAIVAVILSLLGILVYIWVRFGSLRYSIAAIIALIHDVTMSLGLLALSALIGGSAVASALLIEPFRIDLGVVAALLTIIGYSLNDTIVILDRIRENRGKLPLPTAKIVNDSINQTISRTLLTSLTTLLAVAIMYSEGGSGIRPFTFCLLAGIIVGTYSSIAIAAPMVLRHPGGPQPTALPEAAPRSGAGAEPAAT